MLPDQQKEHTQRPKWQNRPAHHAHSLWSAAGGRYPRSLDRSLIYKQQHHVNQSRSSAVGRGHPLEHRRCTELLPRCCCTTCELRVGPLPVYHQEDRTQVYSESDIGSASIWCRNSRSGTKTKPNYTGTARCLFITEARL